MEHYDVVIIGAGMSGLAAGVRLAHYGKRVLIVEKHTVWGGLNSFYKKGGHHFDVGLHAVTNWLRPGYRGPRIPMQRILRQLRIPADAFELEPQTHSSVRFDDTRLRFSNDLELLKSEVARVFPGQIDGFAALDAACAEYPAANDDAPFVSTKERLAEFISDPLLQNMLLAPLLYYGSAIENDVDWDQFVILFNSIYREGFCRPRRGVKAVLDVLVQKFETLGGEMRRRCPVASIEVQDGRVGVLRLGRGEDVSADVVLSSAGRVETARLRSDLDASAETEHIGQLGFVENLWVLDKAPKELGFDDCVTFYNRGPEFAWRCPEQPVGLESGVLCVPENYDHGGPLERHLLRATHLANPQHWFGLDDEDYAREKAEWMRASVCRVGELGQSFSDHVLYSDGFTPKTVTRFTSHVNGAIYGSPNKLKTGTTDLANLFLCGTDQGFVGIVGAMLSGVAIANRHVLQGGPS